MEFEKLDVADLRRLIRGSDILRAVYTEASASISILPEEPPLWYERFIMFFLPAFLTSGEYGALTEAYYTYYEQKHGYRPTRRGYTASWGQAARKWRWKDRARKAVTEIASRYAKEAADAQLSEVIQDLIRERLELEVRLRIKAGSRTRYLPLGTVDL